MGLSFLNTETFSALSHLNLNFVTEIRLRAGKPVVVEYRGKYRFLGRSGISSGKDDRIRAEDIPQTLARATDGCIYAYNEQLKNGFITVGHGVRIGVAGEYVTEGGHVTTIKNVTSLNIRVPHEIVGCGDRIYNSLLQNGLKNVLVFSKPGLGKTTLLRDLARKISIEKPVNVLVFDERGEISGMDAYGTGYDLGFADVVRSSNKLSAISSAIRAMKPELIVTDELYGENDVKAVKYATECGIFVIASSHICDKKILSAMPFDYFAQLTSQGGELKIYDKNFNAVGDNRPHDLFGEPDSVE